jgi:hypothetical protein
MQGHELWIDAPFRFSGVGHGDDAGPNRLGNRRGQSRSQRRLRSVGVKPAVHIALEGEVGRLSRMVGFGERWSLIWGGVHKRIGRPHRGQFIEMIGSAIFER